MRRVLTLGLTLLLAASCSVTNYLDPRKPYPQTSHGVPRDQALAILADAEQGTDPVVIAGDFNSQGLGRLCAERGYCWPTRAVGPTVHGFSVDHVFARGLCGPETKLRAGVARDVKDASDHRPVWAVLGAPPSPAAPAR